MEILRKFSEIFWNEEVSANSINAVKQMNVGKISSQLDKITFIQLHFNVLSSICFKFKVWLPPNTTWKDIEPGSRENVEHADYRHLLWPIPISFVIILLRFTVEK